MAGTDWRAQGERALAAALDGRTPATAPVVDALHAIYCELRATEDERGDHADAMRYLGGKLEEHR